MSEEWPPRSGLWTPTVPRRDAVLQTYASTIIHAPAAVVFDSVIRIAEYKTWNTFAPNSRIVSQPQPHDETDESYMRVGSIMELNVIMDSSKPDKTTATGLRVTDISTPEKQSEYVAAEARDSDGVFTTDLSTVYRVSWQSHGGFAARGLKTERFHEIVMRGEQECEVRTWEVMGGLLAYTVRWMYQKTLDAKFQLWVDDLKKAAERRLEGTEAAA